MSCKYFAVQIFISQILKMTLKSQNWLKPLPMQNLYVYVNTKGWSKIFRVMESWRDSWNKSSKIGFIFGLLLDLQEGQKHNLVLTIYSLRKSCNCNLFSININIMSNSPPWAPALLVERGLKFSRMLTAFTTSSVVFILSSSSMSSSFSFKSSFFDLLQRDNLH